MGFAQLVSGFAANVVAFHSCTTAGQKIFSKPPSADVGPY